MARGKQRLVSELRGALRKFAGVDVRRVGAASAPPTPARTKVTKSTVVFEVDDEFAGLYADAVRRTGSGEVDLGPATANIRARLYNLTQALALTSGIPGLVAECGCFRGLSSYVLCRQLRVEDPSFDGTGLHLFDSFEGLSPLTEHDRPDDPDIPVLGVPRRAGLFGASVEEVRASLSEFPGVSMHKGWIPASLEEAPAERYRLVHVDLDLHDPTLAAIEFFFPRLAPGGVIVCDDYGFVRWPGARTAVDAFCARTGARLLRLSTGQAMLFAPTSDGARVRDRSFIELAR